MSLPSFPAKANPPLRGGAPTSGQMTPAAAKQPARASQHFLRALFLAALTALHPATLPSAEAAFASVIADLKLKLSSRH